MIKILHSADWHMDSPLLSGQSLRQLLLQIPGKVAEICKKQNCDLVLLSGDLFDGPCSAESLQALKNALQEMAVPVFITPGNHDFIGSDSPWLTELWPTNVHIFTRPAIESVVLEDLDCRIYGAAFTSMDCPGLLEGFTADSSEKYNLGIFHGDPTQVNSPYCPVTTEQVKKSNLHYLALGHIHKGGSFRGGKTLCAWPGCPMGRGYDEEGEKGVLLVTVEDSATAEFIPLGMPQWHNLEIPATQGLDSALPPVGNNDYYRITLVGPSEPLDLTALAEKFPHFPNLALRDKTLPPLDIWGSAGEDTFEGMYFKLLREALDQSDEETSRQIVLAAQISRQLLDGQEVVLP